jgi:hypothetical protein
MKLHREICLKTSKVLGQSTFRTWAIKVELKYIITLPQILTSSTTLSRNSCSSYFLLNKGISHFQGLPPCDTMDKWKYWIDKFPSRAPLLRHKTLPNSLLSHQFTGKITRKKIRYLRITLKWKKASRRSTSSNRYILILIFTNPL